jgi:predicted nucleic acid-binding protein
LLRIAAGDIEVAAAHQLVAPTLVRSQALAPLYEAARTGDISAAEGIERVMRINTPKVRFLGDRVLQRQAWKVADQLGWETTYDAEYVALTTLQPDALVTCDKELARAVSGLVETATVDALRMA